MTEETQIGTVSSDNAEQDLAPAMFKSPGCLPLSRIAALDEATFRNWLTHELRNGARVAAIAALPLAQALPASTESPQVMRVYAALAHDLKGCFSVASFDAQGEYASFTPTLPAMHLFERELYEQHLLRPQGHPWLKPVRFCRHADPDWPEIGLADFYRIEGEEMHEVAVGPVHAGVIECGHFRFQCQGEQVMHLEISLGYHHRGLESMLTGTLNKRTLPLFEVAAGDTSIANAWAHCSLVESLSGLKPTRRAQLIRSVALEFERLANHTGDLGAMSGDVGFLPTQAYCGRLRGDYLNMTALICGNRFGRGLLKPGGVNFDISNDLGQDLTERLTQVTRDVQGAYTLYNNSSSSQTRLHGVGILSEKAAYDLGMVGPAARASGLSRDCRMQHPQPGLQELKSSINTLSRGDLAARVNMRAKEIAESSRIIKACLKELAILPMEDTAFLNATPSYPTLPPETLSLSVVEGWRGEVCHMGLTDQHGQFAAYKVVDPSFHNWMGLAMVLRNQQISDFPLCNKSFNLSYCGHDL